MIDLKILKSALIVCIAFQLVLVGCARAWPWFRADLLFGCMLVAAVAGLLYARHLARGFASGALGGAIVGAVGALAGVAAANILGERPDIFMPYAVMIAAFTGAVGGLFGEADAILRAFRNSLR
jgi:uncharacterized membrane protein YeaQ/YmgE (transglycosylase-associated protein family)